MGMTDPVADMLTRIRNANKMRHEKVEMPASRLKSDILSVLKEEGYIVDFNTIKSGPQGKIVVTLKYTLGKERVIKGLKRISKPGLRVYVAHDNLPKVLDGLGIAVISTSKGVMTDRKARETNVGGEIIAYVW
jgi:small subunit ribosomal protein S8